MMWHYQYYYLIEQNMDILTQEEYDWYITQAKQWKEYINKRFDFMETTTTSGQRFLIVRYVYELLATIQRIETMIEGTLSYILK